jgi:hypothetical protein
MFLEWCACIFQHTWNLYPRRPLSGGFQKQPGEASMRTFCAALFIVAMMAPASAYTDEQVSACTPDVMRLCSDAIPDEGRITKCMIQKKKQISATCLMVMKKGSAPASRVAAK